jgi:hypothetical protein
MQLQKLNLKQLFKKFSGTWIALDPENNKVVATANSPKLAIKKAQKVGVSHPVLTRAPKENMVNILSMQKGSPSS